MEPLAYPTKIDIPTKKNGRKVNVRKGFLVLIEAGWINDRDDNGKKDLVLEVKDDGDWSIVRKERLTLARTISRIIDWPLKYWHSSPTV